jgi:hypothetical protein
VRERSPEDAKLLSIETVQDGDTIKITLAGSAETEAHDRLVATIDAIHHEATTSSASAVVVDLRELGFASSSCVKAFVTWLQRIRELDAPKRYKLRFLSNAHHSWQRRSLNALAGFAVGVVEIETERG